MGRLSVICCYFVIQKSALVRHGCNRIVPAALSFRLSNLTNSWSKWYRADYFHRCHWNHLLMLAGVLATFRQGHVSSSASRLRHVRTHRRDAFRLWKLPATRYALVLQAGESGERLRMSSRWIYFRGYRTKGMSELKGRGDTRNAVHGRHLKASATTFH